MPNIITAGNSTNGGTAISTDTSGTLNIVTGSGSGANAITIDASQNVSLSAALSATGNLSFNSGYGSAAVAYGCRAWVNFNGTGTVAIRGSGNVTSITDNGLGVYTVNFTTSMPDANYSVATIADDNSASNPQIITYRSATTSTLLIGIWQSAVGRADAANCCIAIFR